MVRPTTVEDKTTARNVSEDAPRLHKMNLDTRINFQHLKLWELGKNGDFRNTFSFPLDEEKNPEFWGGEMGQFDLAGIGGIECGP